MEIRSTNSNRTMDFCGCQYVVDLDLADHAVAAPVGPLAAAAGHQLAAPDPQRVGHLQRLHGGRGRRRGARTQFRLQSPHVSVFRKGGSQILRRGEGVESAHKNKSPALRIRGQEPRT